MDSIVRYAIFPPLGIARVGSAPEDFYFAPEVSGYIPNVGERFKDAEGRIKRQAVRFRIFGLDAKGNAVKEIVESDDVSIKWEVHLANRKAVNYKFENAMDLGPLSKAAERRNKSVTGADRSQLVIDAGPKTINGRNISGPQYQLNDGFFFTERVSLGELRTDEDGRLIVLGGFGKSASIDGTPPTTFANNDGWYDDTSDGPVRATIRIGNETLEAEAAFVAVCPPNYGQGLFGVVTMYDVVYDMFCQNSNWNFAFPAKPDFSVHIFPIFERLSRNQWVNQGMHFLFGPGSPHNFSDPNFIAQLADPTDDSKSLREELLDWFRDPSEAAAKDVDIPPFYGDGFNEHPSAGIVGLSVTRTQYGWLQEWAAGNFNPTQPLQKPDSFSNISIEDQPDALTKAHLDDCLGGPFHPGIELTWTMRRSSMWKSPFRLKILDRSVVPRDDFGPMLSPSVAIGAGGVVDESGPGTLTRWMGVPWQTDEASCMSGYTTGTYLSLPSFWSARVPNQVFSERSYDRVSDTNLSDRQRSKHFDYRQTWLRYFRSAYLSRIADMVERWDKVGIVEPRNAPANFELNGEQVWVESEADYTTLFAGDSTFQQLLVAENAIDVPVGLTPAGAAMMAAASDQEAADTAPQRPRTLRRDEM